MIQVFSNEWFAKHRKLLCQIANSPIGEKVFGFGKMGHFTYHEVVDITPNSVAELVKNKNGIVELKRHFFNRNEYAIRLHKEFLPLWSLIHAWDMGIANQFAPVLNLGFDTLTKNPGSIGAGNPMDGYTMQDQDNQTWATIRGGAGSSSGASPGLAGNPTVGFLTGSASNWRRLTRSIFCYDTSALTAGATISAVVKSLYGNNKSDTATITPNVNIYLATPASTSSIANGDYTQIGTTAQCDTAVTYAGWNTAGYNDFTFNATGKGNINKTGISCFGVRNASYDVANSEPARNGNTLVARIYATWSDDASNKPKIVVTYSLASAGGGNFLLPLMGVG